MTQGYGVRPQKRTMEAPWECFECYNLETGEVVLSGVNNQDAWREADRRANAAVTRGETLTDWLWQQNIRNG